MEKREVERILSIILKDMTKKNFVSAIHLIAERARDDTANAIYNRMLHGYEKKEILEWITKN